MNNNKFTGTIEDAQVHIYNGQKCLALTINQTDWCGNVYEIKIPHVILSSQKFSLTNEDTVSHDFESNKCLYIPSHNTYLQIGNNSYKIKKDSETDEYATSIIIKEAPPREMTMDELEKKLGYSVKIISKKEEK